MTTRHLVIGLDGADLQLIGELGIRKLPNLFQLMGRGAFAALESVQPPATLPNWATFLTGVDPGVHGVFDFTTRRGYQVRFTGGTVRETATIASRLDRLGMRCACLGFPATWPPEKLDHGVFMSGWDAPVAFEADRSFVWPEALYDDIVDRFGTPRFDDVDEFEAETAGWHDRLPSALCDRVGRKVALGEWLLADREWDLFAIYFGESDTASHYLWGLHDPSSPRHPEGTKVEDREGLCRVYQALDEAVARLVRAAGNEDVEITVVSDHGSGGSSDKVLYLNRALADAGLLELHEGSIASRAVSALKEAALTNLPPAARDRLFRLGGSVLPSLLESRARFGSIDMSRTVAFSDELNYFPAVHLNLRGREPEGTIDPADRLAVLRDVAQALVEIRDPFSQGQVVAKALRREELFDGPHVDRAPDLLLELSFDQQGGREYSYNLQPTCTAPPGTGPFRRLDASEYLGRKGRSLPGSHRPRGLFIAAGPKVAPVGEVDAHIADTTATLLARMDVRVPPEAAGRVLWEALHETEAGSSRSLPDGRAPETRPGDRSKVIARLRALGYVE